ncbi:MAG: heavy metal translocating P-type ATPase [Enterovibrio sp.]
MNSSEIKFAEKNSPRDEHGGKYGGQKVKEAHQHDHEHDYSNAEQPVKAAASCCSTAAPKELASLSASTPVEGGMKTAIRIMQMDCPTEEALIRKKFSGMPSIKSMEFNLIQRVLTVVHAPDALDEVLAAIRSLDFEPEIAGEGLPVKSDPKKHWWPLALSVIAAIGSEAAEFSAGPEWLSAGLALIAIASCGLTTYKKGWVAIRNLNLNINALMSIAVTGAVALGQWPEAAMVMVLFTIAELIEVKSLDRARNAISGLMSLTPETASVYQPDGSWLDVEAQQVTLGAKVRVKPGERIALDGVIVNGRSTVDQAPITGESMPIDKTVGDNVFAGTINQAGSFEYEVTATASGSTLARIIKAIEGAQGARAPTQRFVDKFAQIYTPIVFVSAFAIAILPPLLMAGSWSEWIYKALVLLVIACPCALVISTPVTIVSGLAAAARQGILIKGGVYLEAGRKLSWLALDKTGTITHGKPQQTDFITLNDAKRDIVQQLALSLSSRSDHPVSKAITSASGTQSLQPLAVDDFAALLGQGVSGVIDGERVYLGNHRMVEALGLCSAELESQINALERQGKTVVMLTNSQTVMGLFAVADTVKESSRDAIAQLHQLGVKTVMLTGDNSHTAEAIAKQVGVDEAQGNLLPEDKLTQVNALSEKGTVGMVGDGINDAPALARADIGFAMGAMGTDTAIETADVALMDDDLRKIPHFVRLSQRAHNILVQNISFALGIKAIFLVLTLFGLGTMWMAVFADVGASLLVVGNGLRLLRLKK